MGAGSTLAPSFSVWEIVMRHPGGTLFCTDTSTGNLTERDSFTCKHCNTVVWVPPKANPSDIGGMCYACMGLVCPRCVDKRTCDPFEKKLARAEARHAALRSYGMV